MEEDVASGECSQISHIMYIVHPISAICTNIRQVPAVTHQSHEENYVYVVDVLVLLSLIWRRPQLEAYINVMHGDSEKGFSCYEKLFNCHLRVIDVFGRCLFTSTYIFLLVVCYSPALWHIIEAN